MKRRGTKRQTNLCSNRMRLPPPAYLGVAKTNSPAEVVLELVHVSGFVSGDQPELQNEAAHPGRLPPTGAILDSSGAIKPNQN